MKRVSLVLLMLAATPCLAQESAQEPPPTEVPKMMSTGSDLKNAYDECKSHPSVVAAGTPLDVCMDSYGFIKVDGKWVHKPATR